MYSKGVPFAWGKAEMVVDVECTKKNVFSIIRRHRAG